MKTQNTYTFLRSIKGYILLLSMFILILGTSCTDQKKDNGNFAGSSKRDDISELIKKEDVQAVFALSDKTEIKQSEDGDAICMYDWQGSGEKSVYYSLSLNFASDGQRSASQVDAAWKSQNKAIYERFNLREVSDVGDKASWSDLGGGQLRVAAGGYIFYVSLSAIPGKDNAMDKQTMIDKTSTLARKVIERM